MTSQCDIDREAHLLVRRYGGGAKAVEKLTELGVSRPRAEEMVARSQREQGLTFTRTMGIPLALVGLVVVAIAIRFLIPGLIPDLRLSIPIPLLIVGGFVGLFVLFKFIGRR